MNKVLPISGFPEWLPSVRAVEQRCMETLKKTFEQSGFLNIETRAIEPLDVLLSKGDDKEIYVLKRLHDDPEAKDDNVKFGLHFDLTVPFARYVQEFQNDLVFPFKRYQMQKVWRGERKQEGRYREFYQCDIDIVGSGSLPLAFDAELLRTLNSCMQQLPIPDVTIKINNRKVLQGFYEGVGIDDTAAVLRVVDKIAKIGADEVLKQLVNDLGLSHIAAEKCLALGQITANDLTFIDQVKALEVESELLDEGLNELKYVLNLNPHDNIYVDLSIARGLDYYTGTVYEGFLNGHEHIGAVCSGGRYDHLVKSSRTALPGVGVSIGLTRLLGYLNQAGLLDVPTQAQTQVLVLLNDEESRAKSWVTADALRAKGINVEVFHNPVGFGKQMKYAHKKGVQYVLFLEENDTYAVKHLASGEQYVIDINSWVPEA